MMNTRHAVVAGITSLACALPAAAAVAGRGSQETPTLVEQVRDATRSLRDVDNAVAAGYVSEGACVSGPEEGAMGVHYGKGDLVIDGELHADQPELLIYEQRDGRLGLVGVEFLVFVDAWNEAGNTAPPVLSGQQFHIVNSPNRYGIPAFYELHVWAWKNNPHGTFVDWNPTVSCSDYAGELASHHPSTHDGG
jgi:hypothetical protein